MDEKISYRTISTMAIIWLLLLGYLLWAPSLTEHSGTVSSLILEKGADQQIVTFSIDMPDDRTIQYNNVSGEWMIQEPYRAAANESMILELIEAVKNTRIMDVVEEHPGSLIPYGLDEDKRITVTLGLQDEEEHIFHIGTRLPLNQIYVYFQKEGDPSVFRAWEGMRLIIEKHAAVLDQGHPVQFNPSSLVSLDLAHQGYSLHLEKQEEHWFITSPVQRAADNQVVQSYLESILALTSRGSTAGTITPEKLRGPDYLRIALNQGKDTGSIILHLGKDDSTPSPILFIEQDSRSIVYSTDPRNLEKLSFDPTTFSLPYALVLEDDTITKIEVSHPRYSLTLNRDPDGSWQFYHPFKGQSGDADMVDQLLYLLGHMVIEHYLDGGKSSADWSEADILIKLSGGKSESTLRIIESPQDHYRGTSTFHPHPYRLNSDTVKQLDEFAPQVLVDRHLLEFDPRSVAQVIVKQKEDDYILTRKGSGWEWETPKKHKARSADAWKLVFGIRDIQYQEQLVEYQASMVNEDLCGIENPDIVIKVLLAGEKAWREIRMELLNNGKKMVVSTSRFPGCYQLERNVVDQILPASFD